jgi:hypothetical protein
LRSTWRALGDLGLERGVAARAAAALDEIAALLRLGQVEERLGHRPGALDQIGGHAVIATTAKPKRWKDSAELLGEAVGIGLLISERKRRDFSESVEHASLRIMLP